MSETLPKIYEALSQVMGDATAVGKDSYNAGQRFNFRGIDAVLNMVAPLLRKYNVIVMPIVEEKDYEVSPTKSGGSMAHVTIKVRYRFVAIDGSYIDAIVYGEAMDVGDKAFTKAMSVAFRTALLQTLAIPTGDPDPDEQSYERGNSYREEKPVEIPSDKLQLLKDATTPEELTAIAEQLRNDASLSADVRKALGYKWKERLAEVNAAPVTVKAAASNVNHLNEINKLYKQMSKPEQLDFFSNVISAGIPSIEDGTKHLTVEQQLRVIEIAEVILAPRQTAILEENGAI